MYYPSIEENNNTRSLIDTWYGYNHKHKVNRGEFYDMENMSSDEYPAASARKERSQLTNADEDKYMRGIIQVGNDIYALWDKYLWNLSTDTMTDVSDLMDDDYESEQKMMVMGSYLLLFPMKAYINLNDVTDRGLMESFFESDEGITISYKPCNYEGSDLENLTVANTSPEGANHGDYWICTDPSMQGLYYYNGYNSDWEAVATSYIKIEIPNVNLTDYFSEGDSIRMNTKIKDINEGSVIQKIADGYIVVIGLMKRATDTQTTSSSWKLKLRRELPQLDYVCVDKNRVWGCHYGYDTNTHKTVNEIYASKLGDFKNWYVYQGLSTDSYALTVGDRGEFTGCISFNGYPHFFKENKIYKIYGNYPAEYQLSEKDAIGVQKGSHKSLCIVNDALIYKGINNVMAYDGANTSIISSEFGNKLYYEGVAGGCLGKYYLLLKNEYNAPHLFVYDTKVGIWMKESAEHFIQFTTSIEGQLYAITDTNAFGLGEHNNSIYLRSERVDEEWTSWFVETGDMGYEDIDKKYISRITLRAYVPTRSEIEVQISYDDRPYDYAGIIRGSNDVGTQSLSFNPFRCDHFRIKLIGHGQVRIYTLAMTTEYGSEE